MGIESNPTDEGAAGAVALEQRIWAPAPAVARYIGDFRNAKEWMVGVEGVERLSEDFYRLLVESPVGKLEPEAKVLEHGGDRVRWEYTAASEGGGGVTVAAADGCSCVGTCKGEFRRRGKC